LSESLAAARARSWRRWWHGNCCQAAGPFRPWDILGRRRDLGVAVEKCRRCVTSAWFVTRWDASRPLAPAAIAAQAYSAWSGPVRATDTSGGSAEAVTVVTVATEGQAGRSGASVTASTASDCGHGGHSGPGPLARRLSEGRPATRSRQARCRSRPAQGSRPPVTALAVTTHWQVTEHWQVTAPPMAFTAPVTAITATDCGRRVRFPRRRRPPGQRLSPGRAGGTKSTGVKRTHVRATRSSFLLKMLNQLRLFTVTNRRSGPRARAGWRF
jgi:hypothetical protein